MRIPCWVGPGVLSALVAAASAAAEPPRGGTIHGAVRTTGGETVQGTIRWGSARFWDERIETAEAAPAAVESEGYRFNLFGWTLFDTADANRVVHRVAVPFGHLRAVEPVRGGGAVLELKNGQRIVAEDIGADVDLRVAVPGRGEVELPWRRVVRVEFAAGPAGPAESERLFGTVTARAVELTGFIEWDRDEATTGEILDGEEQGRERRFAFSEIAAIERASSSSARVVLRSGPAATLSGTNDVNDDNRGIVVRVLGLGAVIVPWDELVRVEFRAAPASPAYQAFDGGKRIEGAVRSVDGAVMRGLIEWDRDERFTWETLDGEQDGLDYEIPFLAIRSIARAEQGGAEVVLRDGRKLRLEGSNDVDAGHRGVVIRQEGGVETILSWDALRDIELF